ncbi:hypothetical protein [Streptomyces sp. NPDC127105]|uniref:hypothetical protein n=1 Tax=Streptomyces sp. NPDC127105 TaxID=3345359 RepID=UPI0036555071
MLRIIDARTGEPVDAAPVRHGLTRVEAHASGCDVSGLRVLLVADILTRALELDGTPVWPLLSGGREQEQELRAAATALGIRPFEDGRGAGIAPGKAQVVHVAAEGADTAAGGVRVAVAPVDAAAPSVPAHDDDPAAWRLALLTHRHTRPVRLDEAALDDARQKLARWRAAVAEWARRPSRPVPDQVRGRLRDAWEDDLDVAAVLRVLEWVGTDPDLADGARFETYAYADRLLGVDLTRDLGRTP